GLVEDSLLAGCADQVGELVEQSRTDAVERAYPRGVEHLRPQVRATRSELGGDPPAQLLGSTLAERDREDLVGSDALLDEPAEPLGGGERLARSGAGCDEERSGGPGVGRGGLLGADLRRADSCRAHSGGAPPNEQIAACGHVPKRVTHVPAISRGAGSKCPALIRSIAVVTTVRLRSRSSSASGRSRYSFSPAGRPTLKMSCRIPPHTQSFGYQSERKRGWNPSGRPSSSKPYLQAM